MPSQIASSVARRISVDEHESSLTGQDEAAASWHHAMRLFLLMPRLVDPEGTDDRATMVTPTWQRIAWFVSSVVLVFTQLLVLLSFASSLSFKRCIDGKACMRGSLCSGRFLQAPYVDPLDTTGTRLLRRGMCVSCSSAAPSGNEVPNLLEDVCDSMMSADSCFVGCGACSNPPVKDPLMKVHLMNLNTSELSCMGACTAACASALDVKASSKLMEATPQGGELDIAGYSNEMSAIMMGSTGVHTLVAWVSTREQCSVCAESNREGVRYMTQAEYESQNVSTMSLFDYVSLMLASLIVGLTVYREVRDMAVGELQTYQLIRREKRRKLVVKVAKAKTSLLVKVNTAKLALEAVSPVSQTFRTAKKFMPSAKVMPPNVTASTTASSQGVSEEATTKEEVPKLDKVEVFQNAVLQDVDELADDDEEAAQLEPTIGKDARESAMQAMRMATEEEDSSYLSSLLDARDHILARYLIGLIAFVRRYIIMPYVLDTVVLMVLRLGGDTVSVMLNTLATLVRADGLKHQESVLPQTPKREAQARMFDSRPAQFMLELDNLAFDAGLSVRTKALIETNWSAKIDKNKVRLFRNLRRYHIIALSVLIVFTVAFVHKSTFSSTLRGVVIARIFLIAIAVGEVFELVQNRSYRGWPFKKDGRLMWGYRPKGEDLRSGNVQRVLLFFFKVYVAFYFKERVAKLQWRFPSFGLFGA